MHFVDKKYDTLPSTCGGDLVNDPIVGESPDGCASACNENFQTCVGFSYFAPEKLCFLFSKFKSAFYYTGCKSLIQQPAFLQENKVKGPTTKLPVMPNCPKFERSRGLCKRSVDQIVSNNWILACTGVGKRGWCLKKL